MTEITNWHYFYKFSNDGIKHSTNVMYTPLVNPEGNIMCMLWDKDSPYRKDNVQEISDEVLDFFFERECKHLLLFQKYSWAPEIYEIDVKQRRIFLEWNNLTINHVFYKFHQPLSEICNDWEQQISKILYDIITEGYYKLALYPHCFYVQNKKIKTFDFYSCVGIQERYIKRSILEDIIGIESKERFQEATTKTGMIDFKIFFNQTMNKQLEKTWIENPFPQLYRNLELNGYIKN